YNRYFKKGLTDRESMKVLYLATFIIGVLGIIIGIALINVESALDAWWKLASIFSGGMLGLFLLGIISRTNRSIGPAIGVIIGSMLIIWLSAGPLILGKDIPGGRIHDYLIIVVGTATIFLFGFIILLLTNNKAVKKSEIK
ncbi:MAG: sodium:solute symporter, partial [Bacteroidales bacterium]